MGPCIVRIF